MADKKYVCLLCNDGVERSYGGTYSHIRHSSFHSEKMDEGRNFAESGKIKGVEPKKPSPTNRHLSMITVQIPVCVVTAGQAVVKIEPIKEDSNG